MDKLINATQHTIAGEEIKIVEFFFEHIPYKPNEERFDIMGFSGFYTPWKNKSSIRKITCKIKTQCPGWYLHVGKKKYKIYRYSCGVFGSFVLEKGVRGIVMFNYGSIHITIYEGNLLPGKFVNLMDYDNPEYWALVEKSNKKVVALTSDGIIF